MDRYYIQLNSPIGLLTLIENKDSLISGIHLNFFPDETLIKLETPLLKLLKKQLNEYFAGSRKEFTIPFKQKLTPFQKEVYDVLKDVGYGYTIEYGDIAYLLNNEKASRAVGNALGKNNILILVPCHRVLGKNSFGGFTGGIETKKKLLMLEGSATIESL